MGTGHNVTILRDDHAGACTALHIAAAKPGVGADHLLGGDGHNAGLYQRGNILNRQVGAVGAAWDTESVLVSRWTCWTTTWPPVKPVRLATTVPARPPPKPRATTPMQAATRSKTFLPPWLFLGSFCGGCGLLE